MDDKELGSVNISVPGNYLPINKEINKSQHSQVTSSYMKHNYTTRNQTHRI